MSANPKPQKYTLVDGSVRWKIRYRNGRQRSTDKSGFRTKTDAIAWWAEQGRKISAGAAPAVRAGKVKMGVLIEDYLERTVDLSPSTIAQRRSHAANWVMPYWAGWPAADITRADVEKWVAWMTEEGAKAPTVNKAHQMLSQILNRAVDDGVVVANVAQRVKLPAEVVRQHPYLTFDEIDELIAAFDPRFRSLVAFLTFTGLRFGEAAALRVGDVDFSLRRVNVSIAVAEVSGYLHEGPTKNRKLRPVAMPAFILDYLRPMVAGRGRDELVFRSAMGMQMRINTWRARYWNRAIREINEQRKLRAAETGAPFEKFPKVTPHDMRHTAASMAIKAGGNVKTIQRNLGHANAAMTLNVYAGILDSDLNEVADTLNTLAEKYNFGGAIAS